MNAVDRKFFVEDGDSAKTICTFEQFSQKVYKERWKIAIVALVVIGIIGISLIATTDVSNSYTEHIETFDHINHSTSSVVHITSSAKMLFAGGGLILTSVTGLMGMLYGQILNMKSNTENSQPTSICAKIGEKLYERRWEIATACFFAIVVAGAILAIEANAADSMTTDLDGGRWTFQAHTSTLVTPQGLTEAGGRMIIGINLTVEGSALLLGLGICKKLSNRKIAPIASYSKRQNSKPPLIIDNQVKNDDL